MEPGSVAAVIRALNEAHVRYLVAGGLAVNAHGYPRPTKDIDIVVELEPANALRALDALRQLGYRPTVEVGPDDFADPEKRREWVEEKDAKVLRLYSDQHRTVLVDLFVRVPFDFERAYAAALRANVAPGVQATFVSFEDLIAMKREALHERPEYLVDIRQLEKVRERERDERDSGPSR